ncbi:hypothetical protein [Chromobacterium sp. CV08]|uniref:hypothetical protein n=1 Tax=Chromobacterium sp. CV08 TaxID=3133274 RepID=UPI003DA980DE
MEIITDSKKIELCIKEKAFNEFEMANKLCALFDNEEDLDMKKIREQLQRMTSKMLNDLIQLNNVVENNSRYAKTLAQASKLYQDEKKLKIFTDIKGKFKEDDKKNNVKLATETFEKLQQDKLKTKTIGEITRVYAGMCEKIKDNEDARKEAEKLKIFNINNPEEAVIQFDQYSKLLGEYRGNNYGKMAFDSSSRARCDGKNGNPAPIWQGLRIAGDIANLLALNQPVATGNTFYLPLLPGDVVRCIDSILGLPEGASISGTTADTLWAIDMLSNRLFLGSIPGKNAQDEDIEVPINTGDPNLILVALAAIVSGYHHTVLEVGLPMTINGYITYQPGFYTSLQDERMAQTLAGKKIKAVLEQHENSPKNHLMIITEEAEQAEGSGKVLRLFDMHTPSEQALFKRAVIMNYDNYRKWHRVAQPHTQPPFPHAFSKHALSRIIPL